MTTKTQAAKAYEPIGDPDHVSYGEDFVWSCSCGKSCAFVTSEKKAEYRAENHEENCRGTVTIDTTH